MKSMSVSVALSFALACGVAFAQEQAPAPQPSTPAPATESHMHHMNPQKETKHLGKELNLTDDQTAKVEPILADEAKKMDDLQANTSLDEQGRHEQMRAIHKDTERQLSGVLTPDQVQQMKSMHKGHHANGAEPNAAAPAGL